MDEGDYLNKKDALLQNKLDNKVQESETFKNFLINLLKSWGYVSTDKRGLLQFFEVVIEDMSDNNLQNQFMEIVMSLYNAGKISYNVEDDDRTYSSLPFNDFTDKDKLTFIKFLVQNQDKIFKR